MRADLGAPGEIVQCFEKRPQAPQVAEEKQSSECLGDGIGDAVAGDDDGNRPLHRIGHIAGESRSA